MIEVDMSPATCRALLVFIYTDKLESGPSLDVTELLATAHRHELAHLRVCPFCPPLLALLCLPLSAQSFLATSSLLIRASTSESLRAGAPQQALRGKRGCVPAFSSPATPLPLPAEPSVCHPSGAGEPSRGGGHRGGTEAGVAAEAGRGADEEAAPACMASWKAWSSCRCCARSLSARAKEEAASASTPWVR